MKAFQEKFGASVVRGEESQGLGLIPAGRLSLSQAMSVYANGYVARLTEALGEIFESVWWVLGDQKFFSVCGKYIAEHDSQSYNLADYGRDFPAFLKSVDVDAPFLPDLARFEWLFHEAFHAPAPAPFDHSELDVLRERSNVSLTFQAAMRLFSSPYSVYEIWKSRAEKSDKVGVFDWDQPQHLYIHKISQNLFIHRLEAPAFYILEPMAQGLSLDQAIDRATALFGDLKEELVSQLFEDLIKTGVISSVQVK